MPVRTCDAAHCSGADAEINEICKEEKWPIGHPVLTRDAHGPCTCTCSCMALGTPVANSPNSFKKIEDYSVGDTVLAAGKDLKWTKSNVAFSQGTTGASRQPFTVFVQYEGGVLIVTSDHLFMLANGTLKRADRLNLKDNLISPEGKPVNIKSVNIGDFYGGFHHIATSTAPPDDSLKDHLLNTNGVVSADYAVQLYCGAGKLDKSIFDDKQLNDPIVGSSEYSKIFGEQTLAIDSLVSAIGLAAMHSSSEAKIMASNYPTGFVPAEKSKVIIPADACSFISEVDAAAIAAAATMRAFNDPLSREWTEYLVQHYKSFYPNVVYHVDWYDDTVNAYAWIENGVRHVALKGGLIRLDVIELEGIALVLAHELAHHYGGAPTYPEGLSCEGQADFFGARNIMRKVWFAEQYIRMMEPAIVQLGRFFGFVPAGAGAGAAGCSHPPGQCRVDTYNAAVDLKPKPACAG